MNDTAISTPNQTLAWHRSRRFVLAAPGTVVFLALATLWVAGCASSSHTSTSSSVGHDPRGLPDSYDQAEILLRTETERWRGTPYRLGGMSRKGLDCSGFVHLLYANVFEVELPRTTSEQLRAGRSVRHHDLRTGDLVFFRTGRKTRHVGVYLGDGEFAHASTSIGVTISRLDEPYWLESYWTARRVLPEDLSSTDEASHDDDQRPLTPGPDPVGSARRVGW